MTALAAYWRPGTDCGDVDRCTAMVSAMAIYGPDDCAVGGVDAAVLGRNLFRLLPEDRFDRQPLAGAGGDLILVADVRLDARDELAVTLGLSSAAVAGMADAALLLAAWERWGVAALPRLVGAFALIAFDRRSQTLTLARDLGGEKPLFWHRGRDFVAAASMPAGLLALPEVPRQPDLASMERMLVFLPPADAHSYHRAVHRVEPGHVVTISPDGVAERRYRELAPRDLGIRTLDDGIDAYREQIDRATQARLRGGGGHVGTHLSGGWDSSAVVGTAARLLAPTGGRITAFTAVPQVGVESRDPYRRFADEGIHAAAAAAMFANVDHVLVPGSGRSPIADLDRYVTLYGRPLLNLCNHVWFSDIRTIARARGMRVLLTGELGNYTISAAPAGLLADYLRRGDWRGWAREGTGALRDGRARLRGVLASSFSPWLPRWLWRRMKGLAATMPMESSLLVHPARVATLLATRAADDTRRRRLDVPGATIETLRSIDPGQGRKAALGGWGIDERDPTADIRLAEFMLSLPPDMFLKNGERRPLARRALADRVPAIILDEKRKGHQAADWHIGLTADRPAVDRLVRRIGDHPAATALIDVVELRSLLRDWPEQGWERPIVHARYRRGLLHALSAGHFIINA